MTKLAKKVTALACAMLMTVGAASQVSAGSATRYLLGSTVTGKTTKTSTTVATAQTSFSGQPVGATKCVIYAQAYIIVDGSTKFGTERYSSTNATSGSVVGTQTAYGGYGGTGYGGHHKMDCIMVDFAVGTTDTFSSIY